MRPTRSSAATKESVFLTTKEEATAAVAMLVMRESLAVRN